MHEHPLRWTWKGFFVYSVAVPAMRLHCVGYCCSMYMKDAGSGDDSRAVASGTAGPVLAGPLFRLLWWAWLYALRMRMRMDYRSRV